MSTFRGHLVYTQQQTHGVFIMKKIALFSVIALSALMVGCTSTQTRDCDGKACDDAQVCADPANCDASKCEKPDCAKKAAACPTGAAKACPTGAKAACGDDCTKPCCADKAAACTHANTAFVCPNGACTADKPCCGDCAAKIAALCPDCKS